MKSSHPWSPLPPFWTICFCVIIQWALGNFLFAHPFHLCVGQMKWSNENKVWEVSLRLHPQDLESAMSAELFADQPGKKLSVEDVDFSVQATRYLDRNFFLRRTPLAMNATELEAILKSEQSELDKQRNQDKPKSSEDRSSIRWIGMEQERGWLWLHFELTAPELQSDRQKFWMVHRLLLDNVERQENTISIDPTLDKRFSLQFHKGSAFQEFAGKK